jgi:hypothetical protein
MLGRGRLSTPCANVLAVRGPKKKKGANKSTGDPMGGEIFNILKEKKDTPILPSEMYPPWLIQLVEPKVNFQSVLMRLYRGERVSRVQFNGLIDTNE